MRVVSFDQIENKKATIYEGDYQTLSNGIVYCEQDGSCVTVLLRDNGFSIIRKSDAQVYQQFTHLAHDECVMQTVYGKIYLETYLKQMHITEKHWCFEYLLYQQDEVISHYVLEFFF